MLYLQPVIDALNKLMVEGRPLIFCVLIFSTLYTQIPYKLLKALNELIAFCFKGWDAEIVSRC